MTFVNAGNDLPQFTLTPTDNHTTPQAGTGRNHDVTVTLVNDAPVLALDGNVTSFTEDAGATAENAVVATYTLTDETSENDANTVTLSDTTNYKLVTATVNGAQKLQVQLTAAGATLANSGIALPTFTLEAADNAEATVKSNKLIITPGFTTANLSLIHI